MHEKADIDQYAESSDNEDGIIEGQMVTTEPAVTENTLDPLRCV